MEKAMSLNSSWSDVSSSSYNNYYYPWYPETIREYYPIYYRIWETEPDKFEQAFKIVNKLMEKKIVEIRKVKDFVELVNEIVDII